MNVFTTDKIRNVVLLGHGGSGKTSLVEAIAYLAGMTKRMGSIDSGNTLSDYDKEEIKRKISLKTSVIPIPWEGYKINILDTPGYQDYIGEVEEAVGEGHLLRRVGPERHGSHLLDRCSNYTIIAAHERYLHVSRTFAARPPGPFPAPGEAGRPPLRASD